ncbi:MAG TPA: hypothetical protein VGH80_09320 [Xanthomonadaceae bacterium]|jgi:hypothetical protein
MSDDDSSATRIDLSNLPEPMRTALANQLAKMPAPLRDRLLREGSPLLDRMIAKMGERAGTGTTPLPSSAAESDPGSGAGDVVKQARSASGSRILGTRPLPTVSPGDSANQIAWLATLAIALILIGAYVLQG